MEQITGLLKTYTTGSDYEPLRVEMEVIPPIFITSPWLHLDSIVAYLCTRDALGELFWSMPTETTIDTSVLDLPFKKTEDVYHTSVGQYDQAKLFKNTIYKRFTDKESFHLTKKQQNGRVKTNQGFFKDFMIDIPMILSNSIVFYCNGDKKELKRLLSNLVAVGKKTSIGGGRVQNISIESTEEDYSFFKDGEIMRPIPSSMRIPVIPGLVFERQPYKPPYWSKSNVRMCAVPKNKIEV